MKSLTSEAPALLDQQLADLMVKICHHEGYTLSKDQQQQLRRLTIAVSTATRMGVITVALPDEVRPEALRELPVFGRPGDYTPLIEEDGHVWLQRYWDYEQRLAQALRARLYSHPLGPAQQQAISRQLQSWYPSHPDNSANWQQQALALAANSRFLIISGGPGTGKTTTVTRLLQLLITQLDYQPQRILLAAPTGKAAMRLLESVRDTRFRLGLPPELAEQFPDQASTLHRLLRYVPGNIRFHYHAHNPLPADVVIVDEASMIDISLMTHLFEALSPRTYLVLLGDRDQLAAVETGSIFRDLCAGANNRYTPQRQAQLDSLLHGTALPPATDSGTPASNPLSDHIVVLQKSWRFTADSGIGQLAAAVRTGAVAKFLRLLQQDWPDVRWHAEQDLHLEALVAGWQEYLRQVHSFNPATQVPEQLSRLFQAFNHFRLLTPLRIGSLGTEQFNQRISLFIRQQLQDWSSGSEFSGRPVMVTQNDYRQQLFNGDIGLTLPDTQGQLRVWFPCQGAFRAISPLRLPRHETAWAMTIHKSQGSEFESVLLVLPDDEELRLLGRELLYTGITRARTQLEIIGKAEILQQAMEQVTPPASRIRERI